MLKHETPRQGLRGSQGSVPGNDQRRERGTVSSVPEPMAIDSIDGLDGCGSKLGYPKRGSLMMYPLVI